MWERAYAATAQEGPTPLATEPGSVALQGACTRDDQCNPAAAAASPVPAAPASATRMKTAMAGSATWASIPRSMPAWPLKRTTRPAPWSMAIAPVARASVGRAAATRQARWRRAAPATSTQPAPPADAAHLVGGTRGTCGCRSDGDCDNGFWCDEGVDTKKNACRRKLNKGEECGTYGDLKVGHRCKPGAAKPRPVSESQASPSCTASEAKAAHRRRRQKLREPHSAGDLRLSDSWAAAFFGILHA